MADLFSILDAPPPAAETATTAVASSTPQPPAAGAKPLPTVSTVITGVATTVTPPTPCCTTSQQTDDGLGDSQASSRLLESDDLFLTELEQNSARRLHLVADELDFILEGTGPQVATSRREAAMQELLKWLQGTEQACTHLRALSRLNDVFRTACQWTLDHRLSCLGLSILQHVVQDPLNCLSDNVQIWDSFRHVLEAAIQEGAHQPVGERAPDKDAEDGSGRLLKRKRSFLAVKAPNHGCRPPGDACAATTTTDDAGCLALSGLVSILLGLGKEEPEAEALLSPVAMGQRTAIAQFRRWFLQHDGYGLLHAVLQRAMAPHRTPPAASLSSPRLQKALEFLALISSTPIVVEHLATNEPGGPRDSVSPPLVAVLVDLLEILQRPGHTDPSATGPAALDVLQILLNLCAQGFAMPWETLAVDDVRAVTTVRLMRCCCSRMATELDAGAGDRDLVHHCLCLLANLTERQPFARREAAALQCGDRPLIPFLVQQFEAALAEGTTAGNVLAGYLAHLLGCLTIQNDANRRSAWEELLRSDIEAGAIEDTNAGNPMVRLVGVLQQFLLFQSEAHVLAQSTLVGVHYVLTQLVAENGIALPKATAPA
eukprot:GGOE01014911.1.p1 GENE.GGOE01014911.1~~GGOE01014911.1.p1  ORF type:complete len:668 (+),score=196.20 GGOE01014911.1:203-2005(+)